MKRPREGKGPTKTSKNLMLLLQEEDQDKCLLNHPSSRDFECKTCNRSFTSFQALGDHKKPKFTNDHSMNDQCLETINPKVHECLICGLEFPTGQALGGHMRRHRSTAVNGVTPSPSSLPVFLEVPTINANVRRVLCVDLNLSPLENGLDVEARSESSHKSHLPLFKHFL